jgi:hypothetical protein
MQAMQKRITTELDSAIEKMGFDKMRSRIPIGLKSGKPIEGYRRTLPRRPGKSAEQERSGSQSAFVLRRRVG